MNKERVITYIDGFNLYFGLKSKDWRRYYWLNLAQLSKNLLKTGQELIITKYFTARISSPPSKVKRQSTFIDALMTLSDFKIFYGNYQSNFIECGRCKAIIETPNEKMTDVNIATELLSDAFKDKFDTAILISADSDLSAPISRVIEIFKDKKVICAFPPDRFSKELSKRASGYFSIGRKKFSASVFPDEIVTKDGFTLHKPASWI
ncbi:MAG: NYN domain-containing protein [Ignavibacteria bacterium]|nr:NYN domain-containing protein [Ignavibacteria bacterium]